MLPLKTILYLGLFIFSAVGAVLYHPFIGVYAYLATYNINPLGQWWGSYLPDFFLRYSFIIGFVTALGAVLHWPKLKFKSFWDRQEVLFCIFIIIIWCSVLLDNNDSINYNVIKMTKVLLIVLLSSHVITTLKHYEGIIWVLILSALFLTIELHSGSGVFRGARLHSGIGGSDFGEGNFLGAHFGFILPFIAIMLLKGSWKIRGLCLISAVMILDSVIIIRSRGIFLGLAAGFAATFLFSLRVKAYRKKIIVLMLLGVAGAFFLTDPAFWVRMETIQVAENDSIFADPTRDSSAEGRLVAWRGALAMSMDHPLGVGVGNFFDFIGLYEPTIPGRDTHNTYLRCLAELGFPGFITLLLLILNAFKMLFILDKETQNHQEDLTKDIHLHILGLKTALVVYLAAGMFISSTYIEEFYWLLLMPVFLKRAIDNEVKNIPETVKTDNNPDT